MRIVAGRFGGRKLRVPRGAVRPTADRVREAWFSRLGDRIADARVVDLFAGSGALGFEALSRGARAVCFVERARGCLQTLERNIGDLDVADRCTVIRADAIRYVRTLDPDRFDIVVADPPYDTTHARDLVHAFLARPFAPILCVEHSAADPMPAGDTRRYGDAALTFLEAP